eukprot:SAG31_NODE_22472_length_524_cov_3.440000_1_plen_67_part_00
MRYIRSAAAAASGRTESPPMGAAFFKKVKSGARPSLTKLIGVHLICNVFTHIHVTRRPTDVTRAGT